MSIKPNYYLPRLLFRLRGWWWGRRWRYFRRRPAVVQPEDLICAKVAHPVQEREANVLDRISNDPLLLPSICSHTTIVVRAPSDTTRAACVNAFGSSSTRHQGFNTNMSSEKNPPENNAHYAGGMRVAEVGRSTSQRGVGTRSRHKHPIVVVRLRRRPPIPRHRSAHRPRFNV